MTTNQIKLSYVMTTYNKLPYLKEAMKRLLENVQEDEEIIVTDGASTDGTVEYLTELYNQGKINQFLSEPDKGEAHGFNKGLLMARGELIKLISDDDAFYYPGIQECKKFMLEHTEVDVLSANVADICIEDLEKIYFYKKCADDYKQWLNNGNAIWFSGLPLMIRRKSLVLSGLFNTGFIHVDIEFSARITRLGLNIAWNTDLIVIRIDNPNSNYRRNKPNTLLLQEEMDRIRFMYDQEYRKNYISKLKQINSLKGIIKIAINRVIAILKSKTAKVFDFLSTEKINQNNDYEIFLIDEINQNGDGQSQNIKPLQLSDDLNFVFNKLYDYMIKINSHKKTEIIHKNTNNFK